MSIKNARFATILTIAFGAMVLLLVAMGATAIVSLQPVRSAFDLALKDRYHKVVQLTQVKDNANQIARSARNTLIMSSAEDIQKELALMAKARAENTELLQELEKNIVSEDAKLAITKLDVARTTFNTELEKFDEMIRQNRGAEARGLLLEEVRPTQLAFMESLDELIKVQSDLMDEASAGANATLQRVAAIIGVFVAVAAVFALFTARWIVRAITGPLETAMRVSSAVAAGDLAVQFDAPEGDNEAARLLRLLKEMQVNLTRLVGTIRNSVESVSTGAAQIAAGNQDLSSRTEEQASNLEQTAASMEELTSTVRQSADSARQANELVGKASEVAGRGGEVVGRVVATMGDIQDSSRKISEIINVIDGIAFQTNILALNAAVEAARAGEQGRGFAVVASEVRSLAQRSAQAAREIKTLIHDSVEKVDSGSRLVATAGETMHEIVTQVQRVTGLIAEISDASREQSSGLGQVNDAVTQLDHVTQQNASLVEESAAAAESLKDQAKQLASAVATFRISEADGAIVVSAAAKPSAIRKTPAKATLPAKAAAPKAAAPRTTTATVAPKPLAAATANLGDWDEF